MPVCFRVLKLRAGRGLKVSPGRKTHSARTDRAQMSKNTRWGGKMKSRPIGQEEIECLEELACLQGGGDRVEPHIVSQDQGFLQVQSCKRLCIWQVQLFVSDDVFCR